MGCFDFTYADNGENVYGRSGYLYITKALSKEIKEGSPLCFTSTDMYGRFDFKIGLQTVTLDVFALYAAMLYLENLISKEPMTEKLARHFTRYLELLRTKNFDADAIEVLEYHEDAIRRFGIKYFYSNFHRISLRTEKISALGRQKAKEIVVGEEFVGELPLLISRKKLPDLRGDDLLQVARFRWGFVSGDDPHQGCKRTKNLYYLFNPRLSDEKEVDLA